MNKLKRLEKSLEIYDSNVKNHPGIAEMERDRFIQNVRYILSLTEEQIDEDIVKPSASEVKQMIDELRAEMNKEFDKVRAAAMLHLQNYHSSAY